MAARDGLIDLDALIATARDLDPLPQTVVQLSRLVADDRSDIAAIESCVASDPVLAGNLIGLANSVMMSGVSEVGSIRSAIMRVGSGVVLSLALGASVRGRVQKAIPAYGLSEGDLWRQSCTAALAAELLPKFQRTKPLHEASTAALLSQVGKLVLSRHLEPQHLKLLADAREHGMLGELAAERELLGVDHGELSGLVVQSWGLPESMRRALTFFSRPDEAKDALCDAVHIAVHAMSRLEARPEAPFPMGSVLERTGMSPDSFLELCDKVSEEVEAMLKRFER